VQLCVLYPTTITEPSSFQTAELSIIEYDIFKFFPTPSHLEPEMKMKPVEFLFRFGAPDYWIDGAYYAPNPKILRSKLWA
jgi:hypothetical protein